LLNIYSYNDRSQLFHFTPLHIIEYLAASWFQTFLPQFSHVLKILYISLSLHFSPPKHALHLFVLIYDSPINIPHYIIPNLIYVAPFQRDFFTNFSSL
jgi:hypothetical protein